MPSHCCTVQRVGIPTSQQLAVQLSGLLPPRASSNPRLGKTIRTRPGNGNVNAIQPVTNAAGKWGRGRRHSFIHSFIHCCIRTCGIRTDTLVTLITVPSRYSRGHSAVPSSWYLDVTAMAARQWTTMDDKRERDGHDDGYRCVAIYLPSVRIIRTLRSIRCHR
ncbi:hypothetical protein LX36DRAFT_229827 [Colletotrichum falcatum]|nr:hypothetical protein LX36DRAFT_229827 [Colletotrichum falcatum]